jgi:hypothetical protein
VRESRANPAHQDEIAAAQSADRAEFIPSAADPQGAYGEWRWQRRSDDFYKTA